MSDDKIIPRHIVIVPDGNRRFATERGKKPWEGHYAGKEIFNKLLEWCKEAGVKELSFWGFSTENLNRDKTEVAVLIKLLDELCDNAMKQLKGKNKEDVVVRFVGNHENIPPKTVEKMKKVMEMTKNNSKYRLNLLIGYGGRWEITHAAKKIAQEVKEGKLNVDDITPKVFEEHLEVQSEPDLLIRTSEQRLSGIFPWQCIYSEIIFLKDKYWPELTKEDFMGCIEEFSRRKRRFGK